MSTCPKCQKELLPFEYKGINLLKCPDCHGFWFLEGKFREVKQVGFSGLSVEHSPETSSEHPSQPTSESEPQNLKCPDCSAPLLPYTYAYSSDIQLHRCTQCHGIWAESDDLVRIEELLTGYKESLDEAKAKALPLMLNVKKQIQQKERAKDEEQKRRKKGFFNRFFGPKESKNRKIQDIFNDFDSDDDENL